MQVGHVWFTQLNCCHGSQGWRRALLLWEHTSKRASRVCWVKKTLRYVSLAPVRQMSVSLTVRCPRAAMMPARVWETPSAVLLFLCLRFFGARHSNHILCLLTAPPLPWLLAKLLPRWLPDALELLGSNLWTSHRSKDAVLRNSASPPSTLVGQSRFTHCCTHD